MIRLSVHLSVYLPPPFLLHFLYLSRASYPSRSWYECPVALYRHVPTAIPQSRLPDDLYRTPSSIHPMALSEDLGLDLVAKWNPREGL